MEKLEINKIFENQKDLEDYLDFLKEWLQKRGKTLISSMSEAYLNTQKIKLNYILYV